MFRHRQDLVMMAQDEKRGGAQAQTRPYELIATSAYTYMRRRLATAGFTGRRMNAASRSARARAGARASTDTDSAKATAALAVCWGMNSENEACCTRVAFIPQYLFEMPESSTCGTGLSGSSIGRE